MELKVGKRKISPKHQVVLPEAVMSALGVKAGDEVEFTLTEAGAVIRKASA